MANPEEKLDDDEFNFDDEGEEVEIELDDDMDSGDPEPAVPGEDTVVTPPEPAAPAVGEDDDFFDDDPEVPDTKAEAPPPVVKPKAKAPPKKKAEKKVESKPKKVEKKPDTKADTKADTKVENPPFATEPPIMPKTRKLRIIDLERQKADITKRLVTIKNRAVMVKSIIQNNRVEVTKQFENHIALLNSIIEALG